MDIKRNLTFIIKGLYLVFLIYLIFKSPLLFLFAGIHEGVHLLVGIKLKYRLRKISLLPFGFSLCFKEDYVKPQHNIVISISGPLTNLIFFGILYFIFYMSQERIFLDMAMVNLALCLFNILPIGFLDGGRVLKSLLAMYVSIFSSNLIINLNGIIFGCIMLVVSLLLFNGLGSFLLILIGISIIYTSYYEIKYLKLNIIKDILYKRFQDMNHKEECSIRFYSDNIKIFNILKRLKFNVSYNIASEYEETLSDRDLIGYYFTKGNITLKECFIEHRRNINVEYKRRDSSKC
ncbi:MAG: hypothetical protein RR912_04495 [Clostridium sp.]